MGDVRRAELPAFDIPKFLDESEAFTREDAAAPAMVKAVSLGRPKMVRLPNGTWVRPESVTQISLRHPKKREDWEKRPPTMVEVSISAAGVTFVSVPPGRVDQEFADEIARLINGE